MLPINTPLMLSGRHDFMISFSSDKKTNEARPGYRDVTYKTKAIDSSNSDKKKSEF